MKVCRTMTDLWRLANTVNPAEASFVYGVYKWAGGEKKLQLTKEMALYTSLMRSYMSVWAGACSSKSAESFLQDLNKYLRRTYNMCIDMRPKMSPFGPPEVVEVVLFPYDENIGQTGTPIKQLIFPLQFGTETDFDILFHAIYELYGCIAMYTYCKEFGVIPEPQIQRNIAYSLERNLSYALGGTYYTDREDYIPHIRQYMLSHINWGVRR